MSQSEGTHCPDLRTLAAFTEGKLGKVEQQAVFTHLAACENCYELVADVLELQEAHRQRDLSSHSPRSGRLPWRNLLLAAALSALVLGLSVVLFGRLPPQRLGSGILVSELPQGRAASFHASFRNLAVSDPIEQMIRVGVRHLDLRLALEGGLSTEAREILHQLMSETQQEGGSNLPLPYYERILAEIDDTRLPSSGKALAHLRRAEDLLRPTRGKSSSDRASLYFELGQWGETVRLAILLDDTSPVNQRAFRSSTARLARHLESPYRERFEAVAKVLPKRGVWVRPQVILAEVEKLLHRKTELE